MNVHPALFAGGTTGALVLPGYKEIQNRARFCFAFGFLETYIPVSEKKTKQINNYWILFIHPTSFYIPRRICLGYPYLSSVYFKLF